MFFFLLLVCDKGFFRDPKTGLCKACKGGTYSTEYDSTSCESCPEGQTTYFAAESSADRCVGKKTTVLKILLSFWNVITGHMTRRRGSATRGSCIWWEGVCIRRDEVCIQGEGDLHPWGDGSAETHQNWEKRAVHHLLEFWFILTIPIFSRS